MVTATIYGDRNTVDMVDGVEPYSQFCANEVLASPQGVLHVNMDANLAMLACWRGCAWAMKPSENCLEGFRSIEANSAVHLAFG